MRSSDCIILRDDTGKPLTQSNPDRIGIETYKKQVWERYNRTREKRVDAPSEIVPMEVLNGHIIEREEAALTNIDNLGNFLTFSPHLILLLLLPLWRWMGNTALCVER